MDALTGLPDFQAPIAVGRAQLFAPFGQGSFSVMPSQLSLACDASGRPIFGLAIVKRGDDLTPAGRYAALSIELTLDYPLDDALIAARGVASDAALKPLAINTGYARLCPAGGAVGLPGEATAPVPLGWAGVDVARWTMRLSADSGELLKGALAGGALLFNVHFEFAVMGVAARLPVSVQFEPRKLIDALRATVPGRPLDNAALVGFFLGAADAPPLQCTGSADATLFAQSMADRLAAAYGSLVPAASPGDSPALAFPASDQLEPVATSWDLRVPAAGARQFAMTLDPSPILVAAVARDGIDAFVKQIAVPALDIGFRGIDLAANLPRNRVGIAALGARVAIPAAPPDRANPINATVTFTPPADAGAATFRLSPREPLRYALTTFAVLVTGNSVQEYEATPRALDALWLQLQASDFPVAFAHVSASDRLLAQASVSGDVSYAVGGKAVKQHFALETDAADATVAVPVIADHALMALSAVAKDGGASLALPPLAPGLVRLDVTSFREYGPHRFRIDATLGDGAAPLALEFRPEERNDDPSAVATVILTPQQPAQDWGYVTTSPFRSGYRFRKAAPAQDALDAGWSELRSPFLPLHLDADGVPLSDAAAGAATVFTIDGARFWSAGDAAGTLYYLPAAPVAERDTQNRPTLMLLRAGPTAILQLGAHFDLSQAEQAAALAKIALKQPALANVRLQPAPVTVERADVALADPSGKLAEVKSTASSGFPPYAAVFSIMLSGDQAAQAAAAINGRSGLLFVEYSISLPPDFAAALAGVPPTQVLRSDVATWFGTGEGASHIRLAG